MTKVSVPNKPSDFEIDGVSIIILPDKIIVDTGGKSRNGSKVKHTYKSEKRSSDIIDGDTGMPEGGLIGAMLGVKEKWDQRKKK
jgi:hypothetical protein